jgi:sugar lactone lactonase YvrE
MLGLVPLTINTVHAQDENRQYEIVARFASETPPGNIAVGSNGRIFMSVHEFYGKDLRVVELLQDGKTQPYPNDEWAFSAQKRDKGGLNGVLGLNIDKNGILWLLDVSTDDSAGRLVGWDTNKEMLHRVIYLAKPVINEQSFLNDLALDTKHNAIYIADTGIGSIIVVDLITGEARKVLSSAMQTKAEDLNMVIDNKVVMLGGKPAKLGINPITISHDFEYVYFGAMTGTSLYKIKTQALRDKTLNEAALVDAIERYGDKPISDGITVDNQGNVYITSITDDSIGVTLPDGRYQTLIQADDLSWPDGLAVGPNNYIYATINELHRSPVLNGQNATQGEFKIIRFKALTKAKPGR